MHKKYDLLVDKGFKQRELMDKMIFLQQLHPAYQKYKGDYFQEWDYRQRVIHDRIWAPYFTVHQAKGANGGLWPKDLTHGNSKNPGMINHVYNLMTGYHYNPPFGHDVPEGKFFNPFFDHMIIGIWSSECLLSYMTEWLSMKMELQHQLLRWLMMYLNILCFYQEIEFYNSLFTAIFHINIFYLNIICIIFIPISLLLFYQKSSPVKLFVFDFSLKLM